MKKAISKIFSAFKRAKGDVENRATTEGGAEVKDDSTKRELLRSEFLLFRHILAPEDKFTSRGGNLI
jgi:hypothetical protein